MLLLDESDKKDLLSKAEIMRELGRFDEAMATLDKVVGGERSAIVQNMRHLIEQCDSCVSPLPQSLPTLQRITEDASRRFCQIPGPANSG